MARSARLVVVTSLLVALPLAGTAQTAKPPPRLPPPPSQANQIPGGLDTGTPGGSDSLQLGTPVTSNAPGQGMTLRSQSAAARAAARPKPTASSADCTKPVAPSAGDKEPAPLPKPSITGKTKPAPTKPPVAPGATRLDC